MDHTFNLMFLSLARSNETKLIRLIICDGRNCDMRNVASFKYICMLLTVQFGDLILQNLDRVLTTCVIRSWQVQLYPKLRK